MTVRVAVAPSVLSWALDVTGADAENLRERFKVDRWQAGEIRPTLKQLESFAKATAVAFGYFLLPQPPAWTLPVPDFREGFGDAPISSTNLVAVLGQSQRRQEWYRDYALSLGAEPLEFVRSAADLEPIGAAAEIRAALGTEVSSRRGTRDETRKTLLRAFEALGGLTVATSLGGNNTRRPLDENEFRGFALVDEIAPLIFVNTRQTLNGQIFTLAHEFAHVWHGTSGIGNEDPRADGQSAVERWCNAVASEILVPADELAGVFRCGTLVVLQALRRTGVRRFEAFGDAYETEVSRLRDLSDGRQGAGGDHYHNQTFRVGERLSRALVADSLEGRTSIHEALRLMSMTSLSTFDEYARRLGAA